MSESNVKRTPRVRRIRHRGRGSQILIYLGKQFRFFINESDWKVLPMAAVIAGLVGMVIRRRFFINMEGSLIGAFALACMAIWNGCFNSIQAVCRERPIIKREHRSGMHISSYVAAHMIYQFFLCTAQTGLATYVLNMLGVRFPPQGFMTGMMASFAPEKTTIYFEDGSADYMIERKKNQSYYNCPSIISGFSCPSR